MPPENKFDPKSLFIKEKKDNIHSSKAARTKLEKGIQKGVDAIKVSFGPNGTNAIVEEKMYPGHRVTNDGKMILMPISLADPVENIGLNLLKEVADKSDKESGDGRKSSIVLTGAILKEGIDNETSPVELKNSLTECLPIILENIDKQTKHVSVDKIGEIAQIASESEEIGETFQEMYNLIGRDGIIEVENSNTPLTLFEVTEGVRLLGAGFMYPYMANDTKGREAVYRNPKILITKDKISNVIELDNILKELHKKGTTEIVIMCDDIDLNVSQSVAMLHAGVDMTGRPTASFKSLVIKAPVLWKDWIFEDFAKITGATIVDKKEGRTLRNFNFTWLGTCEKIVTSKDDTVVMGIKDISSHLENIAQENTDDSRLRLSRLKTKTAVLKLGANSETELSYKRGKALDARNASYLALQGGVVQGGGVALYKVSKELEKIHTVGGQILSNALKYPLRQILENMNDKSDPDDVIFKKVLDPAIVVKNSITNALSVASTVLTTKVVITYPEN